jgi:hypothetical protein
LRIILEIHEKVLADLYIDTLHSNLQVIDFQRLRSNCVTLEAEASRCPLSERCLPPKLSRRREHMKRIKRG